MRKGFRHWPKWHVCNQARTFSRRPTRMLPNVSCPCVGSWARTLLPAATAGALSRIAARVTRREAAKRRFILRNATEFDRIERNDVKMRTCKQPKEFVSSLCGLGNKKKQSQHWHFEGQCCMQEKPVMSSSHAALAFRRPMLHANNERRVLALGCSRVRTTGEVEAAKFWSVERVTFDYVPFFAFLVAH